MSTGVNDLRVQKTKRAIQNALVELITEKGFDAITIADIASKAMINRSTFYQHYRDKYQLVERLFEEAAEKARARVRPVEGAFTSIEELLPVLTSDIGPVVELFTYIAENAPLFKALLRSSGSAWFQDRLRRYFANFNVDTIELIGGLFPNDEAPAGESPPPEIVAAFASNYLVACLAWWLEGDMKTSPSQLAHWIRRFILTGIIGRYPEGLASRLANQD